MSLVKCIKNDFLFLYKYRIYHVYFFILLFYIFLLYVLDGEIYQYAKILIILSDPLVLGFFFIGGIFLIEKNEGLLKYHFITPIKPTEYIMSKTFVLALSGTIIALILSLIKTIDFNYLTLIIIFIDGSFMTLFGQLIALRCKNVNDYLVKSVIYTLILFIPSILQLLLNEITILKFNPLSLTYYALIESYFNNFSNSFGFILALIGYTLIILSFTINKFKKVLYGGEL